MGASLVVHHGQLCVGRISLVSWASRESGAHLLASESRRAALTFPCVMSFAK